MIDAPWWKDAVVYQIYPASFKDSNNDGLGDIQGIISKLDYLQALGVNTMWVCPMYASPQIDMGYDISDYKDVYPPYGTVADMEDLLHQAHSRGMKVLLDLVINHTSDQHAWFKESRSSKTNPKRDWYIWKPAKIDKHGNRQAPNNWRANFGGSVWEWDELTQEYYLHLFATEQPDLNWENDATRQAVYKDAMIFWLDKGVDGFRIDTVNMYSKPSHYPDAEITDSDAFLQEAALVYVNGPRMDEYLMEMNEILKRYNAVSIGECPQTPDMERVRRYVSAQEKQLDMVFQFDISDVGIDKVHKFRSKPHNHKLTDMKSAIARTQSLISPTSDSWTTAFMENHDQGRSISRFGNDTTPELSIRSGKMLALFNTCLSGTLFIYQGQELGCVNLPMSYPIEDYQDLDSLNYYNLVKERSHGDKEQLAKAMSAIQYLARDHARTPMQWEPTLPHGGFTGEGVKPWMKLNPFTTIINAEQQIDDPHSVMSFWKKILQLRQKHKELFVHGVFELVDVDNENVFSFLKHSKNEKALVVCNFSDGESKLPFFGSGDLLISNVDDSKEDTLEAWEGRVYLFN
ncbi:maltase [Aureobasidium pullulans]|uniref:Alpha-glucosidase n=1 Tax=Aureobasidium pullulans TaxID=5580 RepID=A0A4S9YFL4_AURPU|nr:maltase [Aureobasidium pullulans]THZ48521.1 maltase [Aureobasidium pullulans]THZ63864.1 maltase [Aureobasidium pullulans]THZ91842.1 maltase [Aureobasidium pullulans]